MDQSLDILRYMWENALEIEGIEDNDNFFILGGDSMLASIVTLSIAEAIVSDISLLDLYENPTLKQFANLVDQRSKLNNLII